MLQVPGVKTAVAAVHGFIAVGMSSGVISLQMPHGAATAEGGTSR